MFKKKTKCGVCGYCFAPKKEEIYTAEEPHGVFEALTKALTRFSAIDCPRCGCQIPLAIRVPRVNLAPAVEEGEADENEVAENA
jgi:hypothetical protein